ncbi:membrane protein insertion efficiency factor YidD [Georgenia wangjunii]|uniref:membrane protein insertion efficiency factor YidD n=1 Tax=Georgenia wangjunii TaxID=3117730 RepID=UPI002F26416A
MSGDGRPRNPLTLVLLALVRGYQLIVSPWFPASCKYYPSCSAYAVTALHRHGPLRGGRLALWRLLRCNPWSEGGVDHVPGHDPVQENVEGARTLEAGTGGARNVAPKDS